MKKIYTKLGALLVVSMLFTGCSSPATTSKNDVKPDSSVHQSAQMKVDENKEREATVKFDVAQADAMLNEVENKKSDAKFVQDKTTKVLFDNLEVASNKIVKVIKHGDHWHVFTVDGREFITYTDPSKATDTAKLLNEAATTVDNVSQLSSKIVRFYQHGDHWHVFTADGKEYITHTDPNLAGDTESLLNEAAPTIGSTSELSSEIVRYYQHNDHWHVFTADGREYITYTDPTGGGSGSGSDGSTHLNINDLVGLEEAHYETNVGPFARVLNHVDHYHVYLPDDPTEYIISEHEFKLAVATGKYIVNGKAKVEIYPSSATKVSGNRLVTTLGQNLDFYVYYGQRGENGFTDLTEEDDVAEYKWYISRPGSNTWEPISGESEDDNFIYEVGDADNDALLKSVVLDSQGNILTEYVNHIVVKNPDRSVSKKTLEVIDNTWAFYGSDEDKKFLWWHVNHWHGEPTDWYNDLHLENAPQDYVPDEDHEVMSFIPGKRFFRHGNKVYMLDGESTKVLLPPVGSSEDAIKAFIPGYSQEGGVPHISFKSEGEEAEANAKKDGKKAESTKLEDEGRVEEEKLEESEVAENEAPVSADEAETDEEEADEKEAADEDVVSEDESEDESEDGQDADGDEVADESEVGGESAVAAGDIESAPTEPTVGTVSQPEESKASEVVSEENEETVADGSAGTENSPVVVTPTVEDDVAVSPAPVGGEAETIDPNSESVSEPVLVSAD